jgi:DNA-binding transcriptional LysR family regulator
MELFQLRGFLEVAELGSVTKAAESLCLTQPAVTQQIQSLEREVGIALFDRTGRGVRLTEAGEVLVEYVRRSLAVLDEAQGRIDDLRSGASGRLVVGAGVTTSIFRLPAWLRVFRGRYPGVDVTVRTGRSAEVAKMVLRREIDLGLVTSPIEHPDLRVAELFEERIVLVGPPSREPTGRLIGAEELNAAPLILFPKGTGFRDYLDRALADAGVRPVVKMETDSVEAIKSFVAVGRGVSFLPEGAVEAEVASGTLAVVEMEPLLGLSRKTSVIYRPDRYLSTAARGFLSILTT